jgi:hypothetical protein
MLPGDLAERGRGTASVAPDVLLEADPFGVRDQHLQAGNRIWKIRFSSSTGYWLIDNSKSTVRPLSASVDMPVLPRCEVRADADLGAGRISIATLRREPGAGAATPARTSARVDVEPVQ